MCPNDLAVQFRDTMIEDCRKLPAGAVLLLSGGLDSGCILAACVEAGVRLDVVTASFGQYPNEDNRRAEARAAVVAPGYPFAHVAIDRDADRAKAVAASAIRLLGNPLKTGVEVAQMVIPLVDHLQAAGYTAVVNGMTGGTLWGVTKETVFAHHKGGHTAWQAARLHGLAVELDDQYPTATGLTRRVVQDAGMLFLDPLLATSDLLLACTYDQLNRPKLKQLALDAFPALKQSPSRTGGLQVVSGVREYMTLLAQEQGYRSAVAWYNALARDMNIPLKVKQ